MKTGDSVKLVRRKPDKEVEMGAPEDGGSKRKNEGGTESMAKHLKHIHR